MRIGRNSPAFRSRKGNGSSLRQYSASSGAEAVILGCTEFGLLVKPEDCAVPLIDTTHAHAMAAVERALA